MTLILKNLEKLIEPKHNNLDAKFWVQKLVLKKYFKKVSNYVLCTSSNITKNYTQKTALEKFSRK
jgi:hypothetical protein